jgi:hypothetical protein
MLVLFCREWYDHSFTGQGRQTQVNSVLGALLKLHYPGLVRMSDDPNAEPVLVSNWEEYKLKKDINHGDAQGLVRHDFWVKS